jgi:hypothetical protein
MPEALKSSRVKADTIISENATISVRSLMEKRHKHRDALRALGQIENDRARGSTSILNPNMCLIHASLHRTLQIV